MSPTLREIADAAGVHHATLSRALRGAPGVSPRRAAELRALAEKMGYVPDPMLSTLAAYRAGRRPAAFHSVIVYLNPTPRAADARRHRSYRAFLDAATCRAEARGFRLELMTTPAGMPPARLTSLLKARNIAGIIVGPADRSCPFLGAPDWNAFPAVRIGQSVTSPALHSVAPERAKAVGLLMDKLLARGHRRPVLLLEARIDQNVEMQWSSAFLRHQLRLPKKDRLPLLLTGPGQDLNGQIPGWVRKHRPDVIVVVGDETLPPLLRRSGWRIPEDLGLAVLVQPNNGPAMSGIDERNHDIGAAAVDLLTGLIIRREHGVPASPHTLLIESGWLDGGTLR